MNEIMITLNGYDSPSDYMVHWESSTPNEVRNVQGHGMPTDTGCWWEHSFTLSPGDFIFCTWYQDDTDDLRLLLQVPVNTDSIEAFLEAARADVESGQSTGRWAAEADRWIHQFAIAKWDLNDEELGDIPHSLTEALHLSGQ